MIVCSSLQWEHLGMIVIMMIMMLVQLRFLKAVMELEDKLKNLPFMR